MRARLAALGASLTLASFAMASAQTEVGPSGLRARDASAELQAVLAEVQPELAACAFPLGRAHEALSGVSFIVVLDERARLRSGIGEAMFGRGSHASCLARVVRRAVGRARPRLVGPARVVLHPFASLPRPAAAPESPVLAPRADTDALLDAMRRAPDDAARLAMLAAELANRRVARPGSSELVSTLRTRRLEAALAMCGLLLGDDARDRLAAAVPRAHRAYFLAVTETGCGVPMPADGRLETAPPAPECSVDADCVLIPRAPPSCCGNSCRGGVSVPRASAEALTAQCTGRERVRCPAMACAYEPGYPVCASGRCALSSGIAPGF